MQAIRKKVLVTGLLDKALEARIAAHHEVNVVPFISIEPVLPEVLRPGLEALLRRQLHVVFTSGNAVKAVAAATGGIAPNWKLFSIEGVTSKSVAAHFGAERLAGTAFSGAGLADVITGSGDVQEVVFFCGDLRRDELPGMLVNSNIAVHEIVVYHTVATPSRVDSHYDAILFFSPSAVESYLRQNKINEEAVCFAIGNTTADSIKNIVANTVLVAHPPQKEKLVEMLLAYYN